MNPGDYPLYERRFHVRTPDGLIKGSFSSYPEAIRFWKSAYPGVEWDEKALIVVVMSYGLADWKKSVGIN